MTDMSLVDLGKKLLESAKLGETEEVRILMTNGAPFTTDWLGTSPLHMAAQYGHIETAEVLLRGGISRDARTKVDRTPLHLACQEGHLEIVKTLINHGAEIDCKDMLRMTPLHWAVENNNYDVVQLLLKNGADVNAVSKFDKTPLIIAEDNKNADLIELLSKHAESSRMQQLKTKVIQSSISSSTSDINSTVPLFIKSEPLPQFTIHKTITQTTRAGAPLISVASAAKISSNISNTALRTSSASSLPVIVPGSLTHVPKSAAATTSVRNTSSDSEEGESNDPGCTSVLATLAALAEATAPNSSITQSDAVQWLESHGITMLPTDNSTIVASALEGGQTVALTEAGKLALTWVKEHQNLNNNSVDVTSTTTEKNGNGNASSHNAATNQKVITIVTDQSHIPSIISSPQTPIVVLKSPQVSTNDSSPPAKRMKISVKEDLVNGNSLSLPVSHASEEEEEKLRLKQELEKTKKEAELYRVQLLQKMHEAEGYKKQLQKMRVLPNVTE